MERLEQFDVPVWLVNTGWTGGPYGVGTRMNIEHTRNMVRAAISGALKDVPTMVDPIFRVAVPTEVPGVPSDVLIPRDTWPDPAAYDRAACPRRSARPAPSARATSARSESPAPARADQPAEGMS